MRQRAVRRRPIEADTSVTRPSMRLAPQTPMAAVTWMTPLRRRLSAEEWDVSDIPDEALLVRHVTVDDAMG